MEALTLACEQSLCLNRGNPLKSPQPISTRQFCFLSSTGFFECEHPFTDKPMVINQARCSKGTAIGP